MSEVRNFLYFGKTKHCNVNIARGGVLLLFNEANVMMVTSMQDNLSFRVSAKIMKLYQTETQYKLHHDNQLLL